MKERLTGARCGIPRPEYPRMQFRRGDDSWINLNGVWDFMPDPGCSGVDRELYKPGIRFTDKITVPFCFESRLSGIGKTDFIESVFYRRSIDIPFGWAGRRILLHFGAVDYHARIWVDGMEAGMHSGGSTAFTVDITRFVKSGHTHSLTVQAEDFPRSREQGLGKQSFSFHSAGCSYTRTTGIWQTVWLEGVHMNALHSCTITADIDRAAVVFAPKFHDRGNGCMLRISVYSGKELVGTANAPAVDGTSLELAIPEQKLWSPGDPHLYDVVMEVHRDGMPVDRVESYFGMRKVHVHGNRMFLNNEPLFVRFVLDQGFYPDGIWTAPSDDALRRDIELAMAMGFNGARLHQKVFEDRFHYWADKLGYLTWAEYPNWGADLKLGAARYHIAAEWAENVVNLRNHPSIIAWTPLNETANPDERILAQTFPEGPGGFSHRQYKVFVAHLYDLTRSLDPTRPVSDASGYVHVKTDIWTVHPYCRDAATFAEFILADAPSGVRQIREYDCEYGGQPYVIDEFGGFMFRPAFLGEAGVPGWGYNGMTIDSPGAFAALVGEQVDVMLDCAFISGYCYTQLTDVEQEQNGLYTDDRVPKVDPAEMAKVFGRIGSK